MDSNTFNNIVKDQLEKSEATLIKKAAEYASEGDRLHNFKLAALLQEISTKQALSGMMTKHTVSVYDIIKSEGPVPSQAYINEKVGDLINYLLLLKAVLHELRPEDDPEKSLFEIEPLAEWEKDLIGSGSNEEFRREFYYRSSDDKFRLAYDQDDVEEFTNNGFRIMTEKEKISKGLTIHVSSKN